MTRPYRPLYIPPDATPIWRDLAAEWGVGLAGPLPDAGRHWLDGPADPLPPRAAIDDAHARLDPPTQEVPMTRPGDPDWILTEGDEPQPAGDDEAAAALASGVLSTDDPAADETWPRITEHPDGEPWPDAFPASWGARGPTERDQAAIDSGASREVTDEELLG